MTQPQFSSANKASIDKIFQLKAELKNLKNEIITHDSNRHSYLALFMLFLFMTFLPIFIAPVPWALFPLKIIVLMGVWGACSLGFLAARLSQNSKYKNKVVLKSQTKAHIEKLVDEFYRKENMTALFQFFNDRQDVYHSLFTSGTIQKYMEEMFAAAKQESFEKKEECLFKLLSLVQQENGYENELKNSKEFKEEFQFISTPAAPTIKASSIVNEAPQKTVELFPQYSYMTTSNSK